MRSIMANALARIKSFNAFTRLDFQEFKKILNSLALALFGLLMYITLCIGLMILILEFSKFIE